MRTRAILAMAACALYALGVFSSAAVSSMPQSGDLRWYKGNTHTHTLNSDGDSTPDEVARWYREQGYNFLVLTDHNFLTSVDGLNALHGADNKFLIIPGEEVTDRLGEKPLHINALNPARLVEPAGGRSVVDVLQRNVNAIRAVQAVPHINHPNFEWAITSDELRQVNAYNLFEIFNGHPTVNNDGGGGVPGLEEVWDMLLSTGRLVYGIAVDDAHVFKRPWDPLAAKPGEGWVFVRAPRLDATSILGALDSGQFYASTGVVLSDYQVTPRGIAIWIAEQPTSKYRVRFIGKNQRLLHETVANPATYDFRGNEGYVRAKVMDSNGKLAWTQPIVVC
jgi:hypothetical protein